MKGFTREETRFSLCGLNCALCSMYLGGYCPGCGGTRAVYLLLTGHPVLSFLYHPIVLYTVFACVYIGVRFAIDALIPPVGRNPFRLTPVWLWGALAILLVNWGVKNFFLLALHIDLLAIPWS